MAFVEKIQEIVGITPSHTDQERMEVRSEANRIATSAWFKLIVEHHVEIETAFAAVKNTNNIETRTSAQQKLATIITGHAIAEEAIVYPFMKLDTSAKDAGHVYTEHSVVKMELAALDQIQDKMSQEYDDKLEMIRAAVAHHMVEEERDFYPELQSKANATDNAKISQHYKMEFERYMS